MKTSKLVFATLVLTSFKSRFLYRYLFIDIGTALFLNLTYTEQSV